MRSQYPQMAEQPKGKNGRLDVKAKTADGELVNTEVQLDAQDFFVDRELFYGDKMMAEEMKSGDSYQDMPKTRVIALMNFILRENNPDIVQPIRFMSYLASVMQGASAASVFKTLPMAKLQLHQRTCGGSFR